MDAQEKIECPLCNTVSCSSCSGIYHYRTTCSDAQRIQREWRCWLRTTRDGDNAKDERIRLERLDAIERSDETYKARTCRHCPHCNRLVEKWTDVTQCIVAEMQMVDEIANLDVIKSLIGRMRNHMSQALERRHLLRSIFSTRLGTILDKLMVIPWLTLCVTTADLLRRCEGDSCGNASIARLSKFVLPLIRASKLHPCLWPPTIPFQFSK